MKRVLTAAAVLVLLAPALAIAASIVTMPGCCAGGDDRITAPMPCCEVTICAAPQPPRQPKAIDAPAPAAIVADLAPVSLITPAGRKQPVAVGASSPPPVRIRLALISTLLI